MKDIIHDIFTLLLVGVTFLSFWVILSILTWDY